MLTKLLIIGLLLVLTIAFYAAVVYQTPEEKRIEDMEQLEWLESLRRHKEENRKEMKGRADH